MGTIGNLYSAIKVTYKGIKRISSWAVPTESRLDKDGLDGVVDHIIKTNRKVRDIFSTNPDRGDRLRKELEYAVLDAYDENHRLRKLAGYIDTMDKALVPVDVIADYMKIMGGVGYGLSTAKELVEMGPKLLYLAYYLKKSGDLVGVVGDLAYEGLSWFLPGSLLDLTNRYANQAEKYVLKTASSKFFDRISRIDEKSIDDKLEGTEMKEAA